MSESRRSHRRKSGMRLTLPLILIGLAVLLLLIMGASALLNQLVPNETTAASARSSPFFCPSETI